MASTVFFSWTDRMSVKSQEIDDQHKQLIGFLNDLYEAFMNRTHKEQVGIIIDKMADYASYHFDTEERYFAAFNYAAQESHIKEHTDFRKKVDEFIQKYHNYNEALTYDVVNFLRNWLQKHIMESDQRYVDCFERNGVK